jgi:hypothetical protein
VKKLEVPSGRSRRLALATGTVAVISLVAAACGGGGGGGKAAANTSSTKAPATTTAPASPAGTGLQAAGSSGAKSSGAKSSGAKSSGAKSSNPAGPAGAFRPAASGTLASLSSDTLEVQSPQSGQTTVNLSSRTVITATVPVSESNVTKGTCIAATGTKGSGGSVDATTVAIFAATKGQCARGFGASGGGGSFTPPKGSGTGGSGPSRTRGTRAPTTRPANLATASGKVTSRSGTKIGVEAVTVSFSKGKVTTKTGPKTVDVSKSTRFTKSERVAAGSLKVGECVTATGSTNSIGAVSATTLIVTQATSSGCSTFGGFGGGFGGFRGADSPGSGSAS